MTTIVRKENYIDVVVKHAADESIFSIQKDASQISIQWKNGTKYIGESGQAINITENDLISIRDSINEVLNQL